MRVFVTGGAGYIGSHTVLKLLRAGHDVLVMDNFSGSSPEVLEHVKLLAGADLDLIGGDIRHGDLMRETFDRFRPDAVIHFAGLKAVAESAEAPLRYYAQNVAGSVELLHAMQEFDCRRLVFSSSATVYGEAHYLPYDERHPLQPINPYGRTKHVIEMIIRDWTESWSEASAVSLRYFNPVGADASGWIGENPSGVPNNLMPYIARVATGRLKQLNIFGNDYDTRDGTGERDYIHVDDLARAHLSALELAAQRHGYEAINVGTGRGTTVLEMLAAFENASGRTIPYRIAPRRNGDVARSIAAVEKARRLMGWTAELGVDEMCATMWRWSSGSVASPRFAPTSLHALEESVR